MKKDRSHCPINYSLEIIGDKWTLLIIRDIVLFKKRTFGELKNSPENIATNILSNRLRILEENGILTKHVNPDNSKVYFYHLTPKGLDLIPVILEMAVWGSKYDPQTVASPAIIKRIQRERKTVIREIIAALKNPDMHFMQRNSS